MKAGGDVHELVPTSGTPPNLISPSLLILPHPFSPSPSQLTYPSLLILLHPLSSSQVDLMHLDLMGRQPHPLLLKLAPQGELELRLEYTDTSCLFGLDVESVCKREQTEVPIIVDKCIAAVEADGLDKVGGRRGVVRVVADAAGVAGVRANPSTSPQVQPVLLQVGIYRVPGSTQVVHKLRDAFIANSHTAQASWKSGIPWHSPCSINTAWSPLALIITPPPRQHPYSLARKR